MYFACKLRVICGCVSGPFLVVGKVLSLASFFWYFVWLCDSDVFLNCGHVGMVGKLNSQGTLDHPLMTLGGGDGIGAVGVVIPQ